MPIPVPSTPSTISVPMLTAMTPAPPPAPVPYNANPVEETEYSFEERRAGFVLPQAHLKTAIQV